MTTTHNAYRLPEAVAALMAALANEAAAEEWARRDAIANAYVAVAGRES